MRARALIIAASSAAFALTLLVGGSVIAVVNDHWTLTPFLLVTPAAAAVAVLYVPAYMRERRARLLMDIARQRPDLIERVERRQVGASGSVCVLKVVGVAEVVIARGNEAHDLHYEFIGLKAYAAKKAGASQSADT